MGYDHLTKIYNQEYLEENFVEFLVNNPKAHFIMIDFEKFKHINDTYGHKEGDNCLKVFASHLDTVFSNSIVCRLHGDEFAVLTSASEKEIESMLQLVKKKINFSANCGLVPVAFSFNAGSCPATVNISDTMEKADVMMYEAKSNASLYQPFDEVIYSKKDDITVLVDRINDYISRDGFSYSVRGYFDRGGFATDMCQIYTKAEDGSSLFGGGEYAKLKKFYDLSKFDAYNIQYITDSLKQVETPVFINIDSISISKTSDICEYLKLLKSISPENFRNIVLCVDLNSLTTDNYSSVARNINVLKDVGFKICLDKVESGITMRMWEDADSDFIRFNHMYWKRSLMNPKVNYSLKKNVELVSTFEKPCVPIFGFVENGIEFEYLKNISQGKTFFSGEYFDYEKKLLLKRDK